MAREITPKEFDESARQSSRGAELTVHLNLDENERFEEGETVALWGRELTVIDVELPRSPMGREKIYLAELTFPAPGRTRG
jgi:hypothetical protein